MIISLIAWVYISIICLVWGHMALSLVGRFSEKQLPVSFICLAGLSVISTLALGLSLFMPLDWSAHVLLLIPALAYGGKKTNRRALGRQAAGMWNQFSPATYGLLAVCILLTLIISAHNIVHPDTLNYHARSILLFERYKAVPGIANLKNEMGFQCAWFASVALFKLDSPSFYNIIFLNGAILCWYFIFVVQKIGASAGKYGWAWLLLLAYTFFSWTQVRLTAASASPDFIVSLYSWAAIFLFVQTDTLTLRQPLYSWLIVLYCVAAFLTKLSAIPLLLLATIALYGSLRLRAVKGMIVYSCLALGILFIRNRIASGYLLYPLSEPDLFHTFWKVKLSTIIDFRHYISTYARFPINDKELKIYWPLPFSSWLPRWWEGITFPDRLLLLGILAGLALYGVCIPVLRRLYLQTSAPDAKKYIFVLLIALGGCVLWFLGAPSPRFGTGFLIPLLFLLYHPLALLRQQRLLSALAPSNLNQDSLSVSAPSTLNQDFLSAPAPSPLNPVFLSAPAPTSLNPGLLRSRLYGKVFLLATICLMGTIAAYSAYRCVYWLTPSELIRPSGIIPVAYEPLGCENIRVDLLKDKIDIRPAAARMDCIRAIGGFSPAGATIGEGFRPAE